jgi:hypothetical protein
LQLRPALTVLAVVAALAAAFAFNVSAAAGDCSAANASAAATAAGFGTVDAPDKKAHLIGVICGPFFGRDSQGMAGMVPVPAGCGISTGWGVFQYTSGSWRLVMKQDNGALIEAVGSDIKETQGYPRRSDPPCSPSRIRTRIWHWNGSSFEAGAWAIALAKTVSFARFRSPNGNLACEFGAGGFPGIGCVSVLPARYVTLLPNGRRNICLHRNPCVFSTKIFSSGNKISAAPVLAYGQQTEQYGISCVSESRGITCRLATGNGFLINTSIKAIG